MWDMPYIILTPTLVGGPCESPNKGKPWGEAIAEGDGGFDR